MFTGSQKGNKRINKKIRRWALEIDEYGDRIKLHWVVGKENVLADSASRNPEDRDLARERSLSVLGGPVKRVMNMMFKGALRSDQEWEAFHNLIDTLGDEDVDRAADESRSRRLIMAPVHDHLAQPSSNVQAPEGLSEPNPREHEKVSRRGPQNSRDVVSAGSSLVGSGVRGAGCSDSLAPAAAVEAEGDQFDAPDRSPSSALNRGDSAANQSSQPQVRPSV